MMIGKMGIYKITNNENRKVYIGKSKNISSRWLQHINMLKKNIHHSAHLQYAWNLYGENNFEFSVIEEVKEIEDLYKREQFYMDQYKSYNEKNGYNICSYAGMPSDYDINIKYKKLLAEFESEPLNHKYEFIENKIVRPFIAARSDNTDDVFTLLIKGLFNYYQSGLINCDTYCEIKLYTKDKNINMHNFDDISCYNFFDIMTNNYFEMIKIYDFKHGYSMNIYRNELVGYQFSYGRENKFCKLFTQTQYEIDEFTLSYI